MAASSHVLIVRIQTGQQGGATLSCPQPACAEGPVRVLKDKLKAQLSHVMKSGQLPAGSAVRMFSQVNACVR